MAERIAFTRVKLPYGWLGNMAPFPVTWRGDSYRTNEALFQAMRFTDLSMREAIRAELSPMGAKMKAKGNADRMVIEPCGEQDCLNMLECLELKLHFHPELRRALTETGDAIITEDITARLNKGGNHRFWGAGLQDGEWIGENMLGQLWMFIR